MLGDPKLFALEYELLNPWPPYGRARVWVDSNWFGDIGREMYLYHMAKMLGSLKSRSLKSNSLGSMRLAYPNPSEVPRDSVLLAGPTWSWGDSFDDFLFVLYGIESEQKVHVLWKLWESSQAHFKDYPSGPHHATVPYALFDEIVGRFLCGLGISE